MALQEIETASLRSGLHPVPQLERFLDRLHHHLADLGRDTRFEGLYFPAHTYRLPGDVPLTSQGLAVLVGPALQVHHDALHPITHVRRPWMARVKQQRVVAHVRVTHRDGGAPLDLFNTHLSLPAFLEVGPHRVHRRMGHGSNQLAEIRNVLDVLSEQAGEAAVLVGDLNTGRGSPAYHHLLDAGLHDAFAAATHDDHATAGVGTARMHIDHVFATPQVQWLDVAGFPYGEPSHPFHGLSDHTPKRVDVAWGDDADVLVDASGQPVPGA